MKLKIELQISTFDSDAVELEIAKHLRSIANKIVDYGVDDLAGHSCKILHKNFLEVGYFRFEDSDD